MNAAGTWADYVMGMAAAGAPVDPSLVGPVYYPTPAPVVAAPAVPAKGKTKSKSSANDVPLDTLDAPQRVEITAKKLPADEALNLPPQQIPRVPVLDGGGRQVGTRPMTKCDLGMCEGQTSTFTTGGQLVMASDNTRTAVGSPRVADAAAARDIIDIGNQFLGLGRTNWNNASIQAMQDTPQFAEYVRQLQPIYGEAAAAIATQNMAQGNGLQGDFLASGYANPAAKAIVGAQQQAQIAARAARNSSQLEAMNGVNPGFNNFVMENKDGTTTPIIGGVPVMPTDPLGISANDMLAANVMSPQSYMQANLMAERQRAQAEAVAQRQVEAARARAVAAQIAAQQRLARMRERSAASRAIFDIREAGRKSHQATAIEAQRARDKAKKDDKNGGSGRNL